METKYELLLNAYADLSKEKVQFQILATEKAIEIQKLTEELEKLKKELEDKERKENEQ